MTPSHVSKPLLVRLSPLTFLYQAGAPRPDGPPNQLGLAYRPSSAFGDGSHPTTRLCAGAVDFLCRTQPIAAMLDVGTGTGVLARIARARGAAFVVGTDIDPTALDAAAQNAGLDEHGTEISFSQYPPDHWGARFDLVAANILERPLRELAPDLAGALASGGQLLLSGFTRLQSPGLRLVYQDHGLIVRSESEHDGWVLLHLQRP